jgi:hypothetical protein
LGAFRSPALLWDSSSLHILTTALFLLLLLLLVGCATLPLGPTATPTSSRCCCPSCCFADQANACGFPSSSGLPPFLVPASAAGGLLLQLLLRQLGPWLLLLLLGPLLLGSLHSTRRPLLPASTLPSSSSSSGCCWGPATCWQAPWLVPTLTTAAPNPWTAQHSTHAATLPASTAGALPCCCWLSC